MFRKTPQRPADRPDQLLSAEADALCRADYGMVSPERVNPHNRYRHRDFAIRTVDLAIPKPRQGLLPAPSGWWSNISAPGGR